MKIDNSLLAPYGSMKFAHLGTKVGTVKIGKKEVSEGVVEKETPKTFE